MNIYSTIQFVAIAALPLLFAITVHEAAHGWVANKLGDKTAFMLGRVTFNPLKHIDLVGTVIVPLIMVFLGGFIFGWAKPVPVAWKNLKKPRRDMALVALAGPFSNLLMAFFWALIAKLAYTLLAGHISNSIIRTIAVFFTIAGQYGIFINCVLLVLNLLPIPPLDGSRVVSSLLPPKLSYVYNKIEPYGIWILLALIAFRILFIIIYPPINYLNHSILDLVNLPSLIGT